MRFALTKSRRHMGQRFLVFGVILGNLVFERFGNKIAAIDLEVVLMEINKEADNGGGGVGRIGERKASCGNTGGFKDLDVYQESYKAMIIVFKKILPILPKDERFDLYDQLRRSVKAIPRLIAEGHSKRHQNKGFQKYIDDAHAESNETIVSINQAKDLYAPQSLLDLCDELLDIYDKISRQLYNLAASWDNFHRRNKYRYRKTPNDSPDATE